MRVLFFEPDFTGHHFAYLGRMLPGFVDLPIEILLATTPQAHASAEFAKLLGPFGHRLQVVPCLTKTPRHPVLSGRHRLRELATSICELKPDHVAVCYADGLWEQASLRTRLGRRPWPRELVVEGWICRNAPRQNATVR